MRLAVAAVAALLVLEPQADAETKPVASDKGEIDLHVAQQEVFVCGFGWSTPYLAGRSKLGIRMLGRDYRETVRTDELRRVGGGDLVVRWTTDRLIVGPFEATTGAAIGYSVYTEHARDKRAADHKAENKRDLKVGKYWFGDLQFGLAVNDSYELREGTFAFRTEIGVGWRNNLYNPEVRRVAGNAEIPSQVIYPYLSINTDVI